MRPGETSSEKSGDINMRKSTWHLTGKRVLITGKEGEKHLYE